MRNFTPDKLWINYQLRNLNQLNPRRYTLTHSDETGDLCLVISSDYAYDKLTAMRDEVLGEWTTKDFQNYYFYVYGRLDGLFTVYPQFNSAPIYIHFQSDDPKYNRIEYYQTFNEY